MPTPAEDRIQAGEHSQAVHVTYIWPLAQSCCAGVPDDLLSLAIFSWQESNSQHDCGRSFLPRRSGSSCHPTH